MMMNTTLEQLRSLKLAGMASGLQEQLTQAGLTAMAFEERLALLVDREVHWRSDKRQARLLKAACLKFPQACIEDIDTRAGRGLDRSGVLGQICRRLIVVQNIITNTVQFHAINWVAFLLLAEAIDAALWHACGGGKDTLDHDELVSALQELVSLLDDALLTCVAEGVTIRAAHEKQARNGGA